MNKTPGLAALAFLFTTGCIYDNQCEADPHAGEVGSGDPRGPGDAGGHGPGDAGGGDTGGSHDDLSSSFFLTPAEAGPGDTLIVSIESESPDVDFAAVQDLLFTGDLRVCTTSARDDELLVTLYVEEDALPGAVDLVIDFGNAERIFVEDAFVIVGDGDDAGGGSGSGGGSGAAADGGCG